MLAPGAGRLAFTGRAGPVGLTGPRSTARERDGVCVTKPHNARAGWGDSRELRPARTASVDNGRSPPSGRRIHPVSAGYHPPVEEYLETILELEEAGIRPMRARIVERLGVSAPAVSETVRRLERDGYLTLDPSRAIALTDAGRDYATSIMRRHRLAERLLVDVLKVPWSQVHEEAGRLEHAISPWLETHLVTLLGDPATCPHGNPIPGSSHTSDHGKEHPLTELPDGTDVVVRRIDEQLEGQHLSMQTLETEAVLPGQAVTVVSRGAGGMHLSVSGRDVDLDLAIAERVFASLS